MENNDNAEINLENNEEIEEADIYADLENNIVNAKNQLNQVNNPKYSFQNKENNQEIQDNSFEEQDLDQNNNIEEDDEDDRLTYTLITLDLGDLIHIFEENNISFVDMLLLSKEDLKELQLKLYQRNRIHNFSMLFNKYAKNYSISEISDFFSFNQKFIFNSSIYDRVIMSQNQNDLWDNDNNNEELNDDEEYNQNENENENDNEINPQKEKYDIDNINYSDYMNFMKNETDKNSKTIYAMQTTPENKMMNNDNFERNVNNNTNYNDIKYSTFNNNNYNNNYYLSKDFNEKNQIKQEPNNIISNLNTNTVKNNPKTKPVINEKININNNSNTNTVKIKKEKQIINSKKITNQPKEPKSKIIVNKKQIQSLSNNQVRQNLNNNNISNITNNDKITAKKKSSNRINAVISKYLEIKQDADDFLEKLNKKKTDSQNKYNKYNLLIKKKNLVNNNINIITTNKNQINSSKKKLSGKMGNKPQSLNNNEFNLNEDINLEYQKMNNQIEELEKINLDMNSRTHLNQIKKYIYEKGENINLDDISKINSELIKMIEIIEKKEKLKQTLENYNLKIEQNKQLLNELNEVDDNEQNYMNNNINNENYGEQINYNNYNNNYLDEVEEEYPNRILNKKK